MILLEEIRSLRAEVCAAIREQTGALIVIQPAVAAA